MKRKLTAILVAAAMVLSLAACGSSSGSGSSSATESAAESLSEAETEAVSDSSADSSSSSDTAVTSGDAVYLPGTYSASSGGMGGQVTVTLTVDETSITDVTIVGDGETPGIGSTAVDEMPAMILAAQSAEVDGVSGATVTSTAIRTALAECLSQAAGAAVVEEEHIYEADVLVLGGGAAGLSAAVSAADEGASVILLEANSSIGGATARSSGRIAVISEDFLAGNPRNDEELASYLEMDESDFPPEYAELLTTAKEQISEYLETDDERRFDSYELNMIDHYLEGFGTDMDGEEVVMDFDLISTALKNTGETWHWLVSKTAMPDTTTYFSDRRVEPEGKGEQLASVLRDTALDLGAVIYTSTRATELVTDEDGKVIGAVATEPDGSEATYYADKGVVIATGGFQSNGEMAAAYQNMLSGVSSSTGSTGPATEQGDGIVMAEALGAALSDMQYFHFMVWAYHGSAVNSENNIITKGFQLLVNKNAERYCADKSSTSTAGQQPDGLFFTVGDAKYYEALGEDYVNDFAARGILFTGDTLEEAAEAAGLDAEALNETVEKFNSYVDAGEDPDFGRTEFDGKVEEAPFVIVKMESAYHLSLGGLVTDTEARVLKDDGSVIDGLYAAGDVTGNIEGTVHQSGDNMSAVLYYGRVAGKNAAAAE